MRLVAAFAYGTILLSVVVAACAAPWALVALLAYAGTR